MSTSTLPVNAPPPSPRLQPAWRGFAAGPWTDDGSTSGTSSSATTRRTPATRPSWPARPPRTTAHVGAADRDVPGRARARRLRRRPAHARRRSRRTRPATSTGTTSSSSACRPTRRSSARSCPTAAGGWSRTALETYGYEPDPAVEEIFTKYRKTHNDGVFDVYPPDVRAARSVAHHHRPARRLRPRPDHRRLPPRRRCTASTR